MKSADRELIRLTAQIYQEIAALKSDDDVACQHDWIKTPYGSKCVLCHEETAADMRVKAF